FVLASEVGCVELDDAEVIEKGRLAPGTMVAVDTQAGVLLRDHEIKQTLAQRGPYLDWVKPNLLRLQEIAGRVIPEPVPDLDLLGLSQRQVAFGYTSEELDMVFKPM